MTQTKSYADAPSSTRTSDPATWATATYSYSGNTDQLAGATYSNWTNAPTADSAFSYDSTGNRTEGSYQHSADNRLTCDGTYHYIYDNEGNRIAKYQGDAPVNNQVPSNATDVTTYTWDNHNRLTGVSHQQTAGGAFDSVVQYKYDVFDRLVAKDLTTGTGLHERYIYDGQNVALVLDAYGVVLDRCLNGPAVDQVLAEEDSTGNVSWLLADNEGSIRDVAVYDAALQETTVTDHLSYDAYGNLAAQTNSAAQPRFTYAGRQFDADAGLYYNRARWYDAKTGRFISEDPAGFAAGDVNLNRYTGNSPLNYIDPSGLDANGLTIIASGTTGGGLYAGGGGHGPLYAEIDPGEPLPPRGHHKVPLDPKDPNGGQIFWLGKTEIELNRGDEIWWEEDGHYKIVRFTPPAPQNYPPPPDSPYPGNRPGPGNYHGGGLYPTAHGPEGQIYPQPTTPPPLSRPPHTETGQAEPATPEPEPEPAGSVWLAICGEICGIGSWVGSLF